MFKQLPVCLCMLVTVFLTCACGNKGELVLPSDPQLPRDLSVISDSVDPPDNQDSDGREKKKKRQ